MQEFTVGDTVKLYGRDDRIGKITEIYMTDSYGGDNGLQWLPWIIIVGSNFNIGFYGTHEFITNNMEIIKRIPRT